jgi:diguanylate cyclase (GGDEF)-like protein
MQRKLKFLLLVLVLATVGNVQSQVERTTGRSTYESKLAKADRARSSNPKVFLELVKQLQEDSATATPIQRQRLKYLEAYEAGVYKDDADKGIALAKALADESKDVTIRYRAEGLVATFSAIKRDFTTGLRYLNSSLELRDSVKDREIKHEGIGAGAMLYNQVGQYQIARKYADELLRSRPSPRIKCGASYVRLESRFELNQLTSDLGEINQVISQCAKINESIFANFSRVILAKKVSSSGDTAQAIAILEGALPEVQATKYPRLIAEVHSVLAELKLSIGDVKAASENAEATVAMGEDIMATAALVSAYETLFKIAEMRNTRSEALDLYKQYAQADKAYQSDVRARELAYEIVRHQTQQKNKEIELLQQNNQLLRVQQTLERESAEKARLAMIFLMLILVGIIFWAIQIKRHQSQLQRLAQTDTLTGLGNRHFFTQKSERALIDAARAGQPAAMVMFDLDHFKAINDTYGHGAGDWVLKQVGKTCSSHCRKVDYLGRIGGEEFAVLLHGLDLAAATRVAEDCRSQLAQIDTRDCGYSFVVTASFGVSSTAQSGYDLSRLLSHADQMLYRAKNEGRNRVCAYNAETAADFKSPKRTPTLSVVGG